MLLCYLRCKRGISKSLPPHRHKCLFMGLSVQLNFKCLGRLIGDDTISCPSFFINEGPASTVLACCREEKDIWINGLGPLSSQVYLRMESEDQILASRPDSILTDRRMWASEAFLGFPLVYSLSKSLLGVILTGGPERHRRTIFTSEELAT